MRGIVTKVLLLILGLAISLTVSAQWTKEEIQKMAKKKVEINTELETLAKNTALALKHSGLRGLLQSEISKSKNREQILESKNFFKTSAQKAKDAPGLQKLSDKFNKTQKLIKTSGMCDLEGLEIYFPVLEHRKKWRGEEDLLVAFSPVGDEEDIEEIIAYSVKSGDRIVLDRYIPPETPVLVIAQSEHETLEIGPPPPPKDEGAIEGPKPKMEKGTLDKSYFGVKYLRIDDDKEPWTRGDPEIYAYYFQRAGSSCQKTYKDLTWINTERSWYNVWSYLARYFNSSYSNSTYIKIYERDEGTYRNYSVTIDGQTCLYGVRDGDDYIASRWLYKSSYGYDWDYYQDWGNAAVKIRKTH
jgi:hypothetical protein